MRYLYVVDYIYPNMHYLEFYNSWIKADGRLERSWRPHQFLPAWKLFE